MPYSTLLNTFAEFGLAAILGFVIGLERELRGGEDVTMGLRDFVLFALLGAVSAFIAFKFDSYWPVLGTFAGLLLLILSRYWMERSRDAGITTEVAGLMTFSLGVLVVMGYPGLSVALAVVTLGVLLPKDELKRFSTKVSSRELKAALLFFSITFVVLPVLPNQTLDHYATFDVGTVVSLDSDKHQVQINWSAAKPGTASPLEVFDANWRFLGTVAIDEANSDGGRGRYWGEQWDRLSTGQNVRSRIGFEPLYVMLGALNPYRIWLIVVLVSFVSFLGYVLIKAIGSGAGIGLTGLVGGLVSSTVTTLSFARRSRETPLAAPLFAVAVLLAASIMFPRLILEIAVFNAPLMKNIALPLAVMGFSGLVVAVFYFRRFNSETAAGQPLKFDNPFSLRSAINFAVVFALILSLTRLATAYLGNQWLPVVALISGLTDADAIAFSISNLQRSGLVSMDWASFNLVLGALSNTFMKLGLVYALGHRSLARHLALGFTVVGIVGIVTMLVYYDLGSMFG